MDQEIQAKRKSVFRNKNFTLTFLGALVSNIGSLFYSFAVSFYILRITGNNALIQGLYLAVGGGVYVAVTLFGGVISDRFNKAKIMYICDYLKGGIIIGFTLLLMFAIRSTEAQVVGLFVVAVLSNAIAGIFTPASAALLPQIVEEEQFQEAQSLFSILSSFQSIIGIVLAGVMYALIPLEALFFIVGGCYICSAISEMFIRYEGTAEKRDEKLTVRAVFGDIKDGFVYLSKIKPLMIMMGCILFLNFFFAPVESNFLPYFIATDVAPSAYLFHEWMDAEMWSSFFMMAFGVGALIMGIILSVTKQLEKCHTAVRFALVGCSISFGVLTLCYGLFKGSALDINVLLVIKVLIYFSIGILITLCNVPASTAMMRIVDKDKFGKVSSVINIGSQGLTPIAMLLGGIALDYLGSLGLLIICAIGFFIPTLVLLFARPINEI